MNPQPQWRGDARKVTKKDLLEWRDHLLTRLAAKTVNDVYLSAVRSLFLWAHENERLPENVAGTVKQPKPKRQRTREAGYTDVEAVTVLKASGHRSEGQGQRGPRALSTMGG